LHKLEREKLNIYETANNKDKVQRKCGTGNAAKDTQREKYERRQRGRTK